MQQLNIERSSRICFLRKIYTPITLPYCFLLFFFFFKWCLPSLSKSMEWEKGGKLHIIERVWGCEVQYATWGVEQKGEMVCREVLRKQTPNILKFNKFWGSLVAQMVKNLSTMQKTRVQSQSWENPLEKGMATYSSILAWRIPWTEEPCKLQSTGLQRVWCNQVSNTHKAPLVVK